MPQYTGGKVCFSRTMQPVQYESKKAEVEVSFMLDTDESMKEALETVANLVEERALLMVGLRKVSKGS